MSAADRPSNEAMRAALRVFQQLYGETPWIAEALQAAYAVDFPAGSGPQQDGERLTAHERGEDWYKGHVIGYQQGCDAERERIAAWLYRQAEEHYSPQHMLGEFAAQLSEQVNASVYYEPLRGPAGDRE
jgi:hypothetical protein